MRWAPIFHLYQPPEWDRSIIDKVARESYRVHIALLEKHPSLKCTMNMTGSLVEQFMEYGYTDIIDGFKRAAERGQVEFLGSAQYHPILALLPEEEIRRQITLHTEVNTRAFGDAYAPKGFWIPELCYSDQVLRIIAEYGYEWIVVDPITIDGPFPHGDQHLQIEGTPLSAVVRSRAASDGFFIPNVRTAQDFRDHVQECHDPKKTLVTALDGENIGHHRPEMAQIFEELIQSNVFQFYTVSEMRAEQTQESTVRLRPSSWASQLSELENGIPYVLWSDPENPIHTALWNLLHVVRRVVNAHTGDPEYAHARTALDKRMMSDQFWWASAKPWWDASILRAMVLKTGSVPEKLLLSTQEQQELNEHTQRVRAFIDEWETTGHAQAVREDYLSHYVTYAYMGGHHIR